MHYKKTLEKHPETDLDAGWAKFQGVRSEVMLESLIRSITDHLIMILLHTKTPIPQEVERKISLTLETNLLHSGLS